MIDRIKNYFQKYLPMALEVTDAEVLAATPTLQPGTPKFTKAKDLMIAKKLDARPKKITPEEEAAAAAPPSAPPILSRVRA